MGAYALTLGFDSPAQDFVSHAAHYLKGSASPRQMLVPDTLLQAAIDAKSSVIANMQTVERSNTVNQTKSFSNVKQCLIDHDFEDHGESQVEASPGPSSDHQIIQKAKASLRGNAHHGREGLTDGSTPGSGRRASPTLPKLKTPSPHGALRVRRRK